MHDPFAHITLPEIEKREMHDEFEDPDLGNRLPDAAQDALPHLSEAELREAAGELAAESVCRFKACKRDFSHRR
jgi:hypothetical protein